MRRQHVEKRRAWTAPELESGPDRVALLSILLELQRVIDDAAADPYGQSGPDA